MCFKIQGEFGPSMVSRKAAGDNRLAAFGLRALERHGARGLPGSPSEDGWLDRQNE
jgi:hypothetical protein